MGRFLVITLATLFTLGVLSLLFPAIYATAFNVGQFGIRWGMLIGLGVAYTYHKFTS